MLKKEPIIRDKIRKIDGPFGWIPRKFIYDGYIKKCTRDDLLLYFFLSAMGDKDGLSFYGDRTVCEMLGIDQCCLKDCRQRLQAKGFIAYQKPLYQVLQLPNGGV